jgi:hypothetical protein
MSDLRHIHDPVLSSLKMEGIRLLFNYSIFRVKQSFLGIKLYNILALPVLLHGSKTWTIEAKDAERITAAEMKYMRRTAGYTWTDYKTNTQIAKE